MMTTDYSSPLPLSIQGPLDMQPYPVLTGIQNTCMAHTSALPPPRPNVYMVVHLVLARRLMVTHFDMDLNPSVPIRELKAELATMLGTPARQQQWFYLNSLLDDSDSLEKVGVVFDSIIEIRPLPDHAPSASFPSAPAEVSAEAVRDQHSREV